MKTYLMAVSAFAALICTSTAKADQNFLSLEQLVVSAPCDAKSLAEVMLDTVVRTNKVQEVRAELERVRQIALAEMNKSADSDEVACQLELSDGIDMLLL